MTELWKPQPINVYQSWIKCIHDQQPLLTDWEKRFILSCEQRMMYGHDLSRDMAEKLEEIYANKTN